MSRCTVDRGDRFADRDSGMLLGRFLRLVTDQNAPLVLRRMQTWILACAVGFVPLWSVAQAQVVTGSGTVGAVSYWAAPAAIAADANLALDSSGRGLSTPAADRGGALFNVLWFGADPTGQSDSAGAVREAVMQMPASGGILHFPPGIYLMDSLESACRPGAPQCVVYVTKPIVVVGSGSPLSTLVFKSVGTADLFQVAVTPSVAFARVESEFRDFTIAPSPTVPRTAGSAINLIPTDLADGGLIENVGFEPGTYNAIHMNGMLNARVRDCRFLNYRHAGVFFENTINPDGGAATIIGNTFQGSPGPEGQLYDAGILHQSGGGLIVVNNKFLSGRYGYLCDWREGDNFSNQLVVRDNTFDGVFGAAVSWKGVTNGVFSSFAVSGNVFVIANVAGATAISVPATNVGVIANLLATGNVIARYGDATIALKFVSIEPANCAWCDAFAITGNQFKLHTAAEHSDQAVTFSPPVSNTYEAGNHRSYYY